MLGVRDGQVRTVQRGVLEGWDIVGETVGFTKIDGAAVPRLTEAVRRADPKADYRRDILPLIESAAAKPA